MYEKFKLLLCLVFNKQKWIDLAEVMDAWRIFPRCMVTAFTYEVYQTTVWFRSLQAPTAEQVGFVSAVLLALSGVMKFYLDSGRRWDGTKTKQDGE